jgi:putative aminopeptidase FrvX
VNDFIAIAERLMRCPAAPYHEQLVATEVEKICSEHGLDCVADQYGNLLASLNSGRKARPLVLAAHMDHPAFVVTKWLGKGGQWKAEFRGGVADSYFKAGTNVILMPGRKVARLGKRLAHKSQEFLLEEQERGESNSRPEYAVWALNDFDVYDGQIHGRACDDLIGVAAALTTLVRLNQSKSRVNVIAAISRAEEVGFHGALALAKSKQLPKSALVISLETSRELPGVRIGEGVIVRVGDRASIFDSDATRFLTEVATDLAKIDGQFKVQRALMSGGTCEGTAYQEHGFQTAAVCVALGNYHNCADNDLIREEYVSVADALGMVELLCAAANEMNNFDKLCSKLSSRLEKLSREALQKLPNHPFNRRNGARRKN